MKFLHNQCSAQSSMPIPSSIDFWTWMIFSYSRIVVEKSPDSVESGWKPTPILHPWKDRFRPWAGDNHPLNRYPMESEGTLGLCSLWMLLLLTHLSSKTDEVNCHGIQLELSISDVFFKLTLALRGALRKNVGPSLIYFSYLTYMDFADILVLIRVINSNWLH